MTPTPPSMNGTSTTPPPTSPQISPATPSSFDVTPFVESAGKVIVLSGSLFYILGLLLVNLYLGHWYVIDYSLLSARFIATGVIFVVFTLVIALLPLIGVFMLFDGMQAGMVRQCSPLLNKYPRVRVPLDRVLVLVAVGAFAAVVYLIHAGLIFFVEVSRQFRVPVAREPSPASEAFLIYMFAFLSVGCLIHAISTPWTKRVRDLGRLAIYAVALLFYMVFFARGVYGSFPFDIGGGSPRQTQLLIDADAVASVTQVGLPFEASSNLSKPVVVLFEGTTMYLVRLDDGNVVQISKDLVQGGRTRSVTPTSTP